MRYRSPCRGLLATDFEQVPGQAPLYPANPFRRQPTFYAKDMRTRVQS